MGGMFLYDVSSMLWFGLVMYKHGLSSDEKVWFESGLVWFGDRALGLTPSGLALHCIVQRLPI